MDKTIEKFIKAEDSLEARIQKHIESRFKTLDLATIMQHPEAELTIFADKLAEEVFQKFSTEAVLAGIQFADDVMLQKKPVDVDPEEPK
jgi:hypothetical protein